MRKKSFCGRQTDEHLRGEVDDDEDTVMIKIISQKRQIIMILFCIMIINVPQKMNYQLFSEKLSAGAQYFILSVKISHFYYITKMTLLHRDENHSKNSFYF